MKIAILVDRHKRNPEINAHSILPTANLLKGFLHRIDNPCYIWGKKLNKHI